MSVVTESLPVRRSRRWLVHVAWAVVALGSLVGGVLLGMRWSGASIGTMAMNNARAESFGRMRIALEALDSDAAAQLRLGTTKLLYNATFSLAGVPRFFDCKPAELQVLARAKTHLDTAMPAQVGPMSDMRTMAYEFCEKPATPVNFP